MITCFLIIIVALLIYALIELKDWIENQDENK
jgi:hypothetical protein